MKIFKYGIESKGKVIKIYDSRKEAEIESQKFCEPKIIKYIRCSKTR